MRNGIAIACLALLASCQGIQDISNLAGTAAAERYALPLVDSRADVAEFIETVADTALVLVGPEGQLRLLYEQPILERGSGELLAAVTDRLPLTVPVLSDRQELPFNQPGVVDLDRIDLSGGEIRYLFRWTVPEAVTAVIRVPQVQRDGQPLRITHRLPAASPDDPWLVVNQLRDADLAGYRILPDQGSVTIEYDAVRADGTRAPLTSFVFQVLDLDIAYAEGFLAAQTFEAPPGSIPIDFYENWRLGSIFLEEPRARLRVANGIGLPLRVRIDSFQVRSVDGQRLPLEGPVVQSGIDFAYPRLDQVGQTLASTFTLQKDNSNLPAIIAAQPVRVDYAFSAVTNPDNDPALRGFITDTSRFRADLELELPLYGRVSDFLTRDTVAIDFAAYANLDHGEFTFRSENQLPLDVRLQAYFLEPTGEVVDSLFDDAELLLRGAPTDELGFALGTVEEELVHTLEREDFARLASATRVALAFRFDSPGPGRSVRLLAGQEVRIRLGAILGLANNP